MNNPLVSVVIASYNHEKFIESTLNSIIGQTYKNIEIIIIDDFSTDNTYDCITKFKDERIQLFRNEKNLGFVHTLNKLISISNGKYISFIGSDDVWEKDKLEKQVTILEKNQEYAACFTRMNFIDESDNVYNNNDGLPFKIEDSFAFNDKSHGGMLREMYYDGNKLAHPTALVRKKVIDEIGLFNEMYRQTQDYDYWIRILLKWPIFVINDELVYYRWKRFDDTSMSVVSNENNNRTINEISLIFLNLFNNIEKELFIEVFNSKLLHSIDDDNDIICEKFFILKDCKILSRECSLPAVLYILQYINDKDVMQKLNDKYNYYINDLYDLTSKHYINYTNCSCDELNHYINVYNQAETEKTKIINSTSWKITKPLRNIKKIIK